MSDKATPTYYECELHAVAPDHDAPCPWCVNAELEARVLRAAQRIAGLEATLRDLTNLKSADVQRIAALEAEVAERVETPAYTQIAEERDELEAEVERLQQTLPPSRWHVTELDTRWQGLVEKWQGTKREAREVKARLDAILSGERLYRTPDDDTYSIGAGEPGDWVYVRLPEGEK